MKTWVNRHPNAKTFADLIKENTGMSDAEFLFPPHNPYVRGLKETAAAIMEYAPVMPVKIVGDYDTDGIMSALIMARLIARITGRMPEVRFPRRFSEGFGISDKIIDETDEGLIITVDNGIAFAPQIQKAKDKGLKVIITDHHELAKGLPLPPADAILDPVVIEGSGFSKYCGAGLAFRLFNEILPGHPDTEKMLCFAAIATVADVVPLVGDNRNIVRDGLQALNRKAGTTGLNVFLEEALGEDTIIDAGKIGYRIAPIINASGRLFDKGPADVCNVLWQDNPEDKEKIREKVPELIERNAIRQKMTEMAMDRLEDAVDKAAPVIVEALDGVSEGIVGIIAGKLAEKYRRPAIVFTDSGEEGVLKGSGRTYGDIDIKALADRVAEDSLFVRMGGHAGALGVSIKKEDLGKVKARFAEELEKTGYDISGETDAEYYDLEVLMPSLCEVWREMEKHAPFGEGNPEPVFRIVKYQGVHRYGGGIYKVMGKENEHIRFYGAPADAVGFNMAQAWEEAGKPEKMEFIGTLSDNYFNGSHNLQVVLKDFVAVES